MTPCIQKKQPGQNRPAAGKAGNLIKAFTAHQPAPDHPGITRAKALLQLANNSVHVRQAIQLQAMADDHTARQQLPIQKKSGPSSSVWGKNHKYSTQMHGSVIQLVKFDTEDEAIAVFKGLNADERRNFFYEYMRLGNEKKWEGFKEKLWMIITDAYNESWGVPPPALTIWREEEINRGDQPEEVSYTGKNNAVLEYAGRNKERKVYVSTPREGNERGLFRFIKVTFKRKNLKQYQVLDPNYTFYTAVPSSAVESILSNGLDPNYGNTKYPTKGSEYNTRGFNYFAASPKIAQIYGNMLPGKDGKKPVILKFTLPEATAVEADPEAPSALRTQVHILPAWIKTP